jgi:transglutaminase-like putative cysteine protease
MNQGRRLVIPRGPRSLLGSAILAGSVAASVMALADLIEPGPWSSVATLAVLGLAAVLAGVRALTRATWVPTVGGVVVAVAGLAMRYGAPEGRIQALPDLASIGRAWELGAVGAHLVRDSTVPMASTKAGELLVVAGALAVLLAADALALGVGWPAMAALPLAAMWLPAVGVGYPAPGRALAWTGGGYLLLLALAAAPPGVLRDKGRRIGIVVASSAAALTVALALGPVLAGFPGWAALGLPNFGTGPLGPLQLEDTLDLRASLGARSNQEVLRYSLATPPVQPIVVTEGADDRPMDGAEEGDLAASPAPSPTTSEPAVLVGSRVLGPLRAMTLSEYDGREWHRSEADDLAGFTPETVLGTVPPGSEPTEIDVSVLVGAMAETRLPVPTSPRTLQIDGDWRYDAARDEVIGAAPTTEGMTYTMQVLVPSITAEELAAAEVGDPPGDDDDLALPQTSRSDDVRALAAQVVGDAGGPYEQALRLQAFFRSTANFTYDTRVAPSRSDDAVWDFLQDRRGYCVQFASSMAVMARTLGIPARVAVGFLPGEATGGEASEYVVTGRLAHAWPELYFDGYGWVRFEPTPAVQSGPPPAWTQTLTGGSSAIGPDLDDLMHGGMGASPGAAATPTAAPGVAAGRGGGASRAGGATGVLAVLTVGGAAVLVVTRSRREATLSSEDAWRRLRRELARRGVTWSDATTPRRVVPTVQDQVASATGAALSGSARDALAGLAGAVERVRYSRSATPTPPAQLRTWVDEVLRAVDERLARSRASARTR